MRGAAAAATGSVRSLGWKRGSAAGRWRRGLLPPGVSRSWHPALPLAPLPGTCSRQVGAPRPREASAAPRRSRAGERVTHRVEPAVPSPRGRMRSSYPAPSLITESGSGGALLSGVQRKKSVRPAPGL